MSTSSSDFPASSNAASDTTSAGAPSQEAPSSSAEVAAQSPRAQTSPDAPEQEAPAAPSEEQRKALRENARRVLRESGAAEILQTLNKHALQGRGHFEEYDSGVIFKWGSGYTRRHIWVDVSGDQLRFRLRPHLKCTAQIPACDGEYHSFTAETWRIPNAVLREVDRNYKHPVAETSDD